MAQDKYLESLEKILSLTERQLNVTYLVSAYLTMGYELVKVDEENAQFALVNVSSKKHPVVLLSCDARRTGTQKNQFEVLMEDIKEYYSNLSGTMSANFTGRAYSIAVFNKDNPRLLAKNLREYCPDFDIEKVTKSVDKMNTIKNTNSVCYRILDQIKTALVDKNMDVENIFNHRVEGRPTVKKSGIEGMWAIDLNGVPRMCRANSEEEAMMKALEAYKKYKVDEYNSKKANTRKVNDIDPNFDVGGDLPSVKDPYFNKGQDLPSGKKVDPRFYTYRDELIRDKSANENNKVVDSEFKKKTDFSYSKSVDPDFSKHATSGKEIDPDFSKFARDGKEIDPGFIRNVPTFKVPRVDDKNDGKDSK